MEMPNIEEINQLIKKNFDPITIKVNNFSIKYHYQNYKLNISIIKNRDLLFTCYNSMYYFANTIHQSSLYNFNRYLLFEIL